MENPSAPVIIAVAQQTWRQSDVTRTPVDALEQVARAALDDAQCSELAAAVDLLATVRPITDSDPNLAAMMPINPGALLAERLGLQGASCMQTVMGGNTPQFLVNYCADKLVSGEVTAALLSGAELLNTFFTALRGGEDLSAWRGDETEPALVVGTDKEPVTAQELAHGMYEPINTYPLFENALQHSLGRSRDEHFQQLAALCEGMSSVAGNNPYAWRNQALSATQIASTDEGNRYVGYPYTKAMNAILAVDMAAAVIMTTAGKARELGLTEQQWVYVHPGVDVHDTWYVSQRQDLSRSPAINTAVNSVLQQADVNLDDIDLFDIYSCFPSAVQVACREIGLSPLDPRGVTVTGGLTFFGGPGNNYSLHGIAEMAARLRGSSQQRYGLVTANGLYLTKHSAGLYSSLAPTTAWQKIDSARLQQQLDQAPAVEVMSEPAGEFTIETYTVAFSKHGPKQAIILAGDGSGRRALAVSRDEDTMAVMLDSDPIGRRCQVSSSEGQASFVLG